ncbi:MAG: hypothetical protein ACI89X_003530 [Planctomycetota bacterium]|jgi:hypothetical protein
MPIHSHPIVLVGAVVTCLLAGCSSDVAGSPDIAAKPHEEVMFVDRTEAAGLAYEHVLPAWPNEIERIFCGATAGDYDGDGFDDVFVVGGAAPCRLFRNRGDGTFLDVTASAGIDLGIAAWTAPAFVDLDGDGDLELFVGGIEGTQPTVLDNLGDGTFASLPAAQFGFACASAAFGDFDRDGDLDVFMAQWGQPPRPAEDSGHLWRNDGRFQFVDVSNKSGLSSSIYVAPRDNTFTPNFVDIDNDGWLDLLIAGDFGNSKVFRNDQHGHFLDETNDVISDENGMGAAIGDYDNDGDLDWFVSSIWDPNGHAEAHWGITGNRLYQNDGNGRFHDATEVAGVRFGYWGWGAAFADFDLDGHLDLVLVNGFGDSPNGSMREFVRDPTCLFLANGDGTFTDRAIELGIDDEGQGRGVITFDYDRDGDLDLFIINNGQPGRLFENVSTRGNYLVITLHDHAPNQHAVGAMLRLRIGETMQTRQLRCGSNFVSQDPTRAHFGMGDRMIADALEVIWPDGTTTVVRNVAANQVLMIEH